MIQYCSEFVNCYIYLKLLKNIQQQGYNLKVITLHTLGLVNIQKYKGCRVNNLHAIRETLFSTKFYTNRGVKFIFKLSTAAPKRPIFIKFNMKKVETFPDISRESASRFPGNRECQKVSGPGNFPGGNSRPGNTSRVALTLF